jgi:hypothetical protein
MAIRSIGTLDDRARLGFVFAYAFVGIAERLIAGVARRAFFLLFFAFGWFGLGFGGFNGRRHTFFGALCRRYSRMADIAFARI